MKTLLIIILALSFSFTGYAQLSESVYKIQMEEVVDTAGYGSVVSPKVITDYPFLRNIPDIECDLSAICYFKMNQYVRADSIPNQIYMFVGRNEVKREKYIAVDANNDHDFSNDELYVFPLPEEPLTREEKIERCVSVEIIVDSLKNEVAHIGVDAFNYWGRRGFADERLEITITFGDHTTAKAQLEGIPIEIDSDRPVNLLDIKINDRTRFSIRYNDLAGELRWQDFHKGDTIHIHDKLFLLSQVEHPNIYLQTVGVLSDGSSVGSQIPVVYALDLNTDDKIFINDLAKDKYVFIDFWGSWCNPCIASLPKLLNFYEKIKDRQDVIMLGIAQEREKKDVDKLKKIINDKGVEWDNFWVLPSEALLKTLQINSFPTYLILDNTGKIVYKKSSSYKTEEAIDLFLDMIGK